MRFLAVLSAGLLLAASLAAEGRPERPSKSKDDFWSTGAAKDDARDDGKAAPMQRPDSPHSYVFAGPCGYFNNGGPKDDINTVGLRLSGCAKDVAPYFSLRIDGFLGFRDVAEGLVELDATLLRGFSIGAGAAYTKRMQLSPRFGLYVEDLDDPAIRAGIYMLEAKGGGIEFSWPIATAWSVAGDFSRERDGQDDYTRILAGLNFRF